MNVTKINDNKGSISQRLRMLADEYDSSDESKKTEYLLIAINEDGSVVNGGCVRDIVSMAGALEIAKMEMFDNYYAGLTATH